MHELARLPRSLVDFYSLVIDNNLKLEKHRRAIAEMALRGRLCTPNASTKMTIAACTACTKMSSPRATDVSASEILDVCSNLVVLDNETENFRFAHLSIRKHLESTLGYRRSEANLFLLEQFLQARIGDYSIRQYLGSVRGRQGPENAAYFLSAPVLDPSSQVGIDTQDSGLGSSRGQSWHNLRYFLHSSVSAPRLDVENHEPSLAFFSSYTSYHWVHHYSALDELDRRTAFELHAKKFLFSGANISEAFIAWAADIVECGLRWHKGWYANSLSSHAVRNEKREFLDLTSDFINNPLNLAFCFGWPEVLDHFKAVQDLSKVRGYMTDGMTWAIRYGQVLAVRWLLARAVRPLEWQLSLAFTLGRENLVRNFYESGMLSAIIVLNGDHVLMYAANYDFQDLFWYLINQGAIVDWRDQAGRTLLSQALTHGGPERIAEWFFEAGGDPETQDKFEDTPLSLSIRRQRQSLFKSLFESAFFANRKRLQGRILLRLAFQYSCYYAASVLLSYGVDPLLEDDRLCAEWRALLSSITIRESRI